MLSEGVLCVRCVALPVAVASSVGDEGGREILFCGPVGGGGVIRVYSTLLRCFWWSYSICGGRHVLAVAREGGC